MRCPDCLHPDSRVIDSRAASDAIRRRRVCEKCGARFTTHERLEPKLAWVEKKSGRREPFLREKVVAGVTLACRKRPVDARTIDTAARQVEALLELAAVNGVVPSALVGHHVMDVLRAVDTVAYVRFASVYQEFESARQFADFIVQLHEPTVVPVPELPGPSEEW